jgi:outer membrane protein
MKSLVIFFLAATLSVLPSMAQQQRFAFVDTEYILNNIPAYRSAQQQIDRLSADWQKEIETQFAEVERLYKNYQAERVMLTEEMRKRREDEIVNKEQAVKDLQMRYYGPEGELAKRQQDLIKPIQDEVFKAIRELAAEGGFAAVFDTAADASILYVNPRQDRSDEVLERLGHRR